jgi:hypothetical protein
MSALRHVRQNILHICGASHRFAARRQSPPHSSGRRKGCTGEFSPRREQHHHLSTFETRL